METYIHTSSWMKLFTGCVFFIQLVPIDSQNAEPIQDTRPSSIEILNQPTVLESGYPLQLLYFCQRRQLVHLDILASSLTKKAVPVFKKRWTCEPHGSNRLRVIKLEPPDRMVFREDYYNKHSIFVLDLILRAWITDIPDEPPILSSYGSSWEGGSSFNTASIRTQSNIKSVPPFSRPYKVHKQTLRWDLELIWKLRKDILPQCPAEEEVVPILPFVYASSGENFGITKTFAPFKNLVLETARRQASAQPRITITTWLYLMRFCPITYCGVFYHLDVKKNYALPTLLLTNTGNLHLQAILKTGVAAAYQTAFTMPLRQWCWLQIDFDSPTANLTVSCGRDKTYIMPFTFSQHLIFDDTIGVFSLGGSPLVQGVEGFFGPSYFYRNHLRGPFREAEFALPSLLSGLNLTRWYDKCNRFTEDVTTLTQIYQSQARHQWQQASCNNVYEEYLTHYTGVAPGPQCREWDAPYQRQRATVSRLLNAMVMKRGDQKLNLASLGRSIHGTFESQVMTRTGLARLKRSLPLLLQAGCLGFHRSFFLVSVLYQTGFGLKVEPTKNSTHLWPLEALKFSLISAQAGERLSLMQLGHKHHMGVDGFPVDHDLSYGYYANVAKRTITDRVNPNRDQAYVETIRLIDDDVLKLQTKETDDLFVWLRYQARHGVSSAQQAVSRMLFWGQQGISSNMKAAVKFYEKGATQQKDPVLMYDYGIVLLRGQGVKKDIPKALEYITKSADKGFVPAINSLGWYYEQYEKDYERAVEFWHKADDLGDMEAPFNLGVIYSQGRYPGKPKDEFVAYRYFWTSATRGHVDAAVHLSVYWNQGIPGAVPRLPLDAVLWSKWASEKNGYLGAILRSALAAYLQRSWPKAILYYLQGAEAGFDAAQFNMAYICEQDPEGLVSRLMPGDCILKYYNLSVHSDNPATYAQIKMGDLLYMAHPKRKRDVSTAIKMYKEAALRHDPQGLYSLGILVEEGVSIPPATLRELGFNASARANRFTILLELYRRCRDHEKDAAYVPCSLALLNIHFKHIWKFHSSTVKFFFAISMALFIAFSIVTVFGRLQNGAPRLQYTV